MYAAAPGNETFMQIFIFRGRVEGLCDKVQGAKNKRQ